MRVFLKKNMPLVYFLATETIGLYIQCIYISTEGFMTTIIHKWGNSLALRIPKLFAVHARITEGKQVRISVDGDKLVIVPISEPEYSLEKLVAGIDQRNIHGAVETGRPAGKEAW